MTEKDKYTTLLEELAELISYKNNFIAVQKYNIETLEKKLNEANCILEEHRNKTKNNDGGQQ